MNKHLLGTNTNKKEQIQQHNVNYDQKGYSEDKNAQKQAKNMPMW